MCLRFRGRMLTAKEDITCYKILRKRGGKYYSAVYNFEYKFRQTYRLRKKLVSNGYYGVEKGFHSYLYPMETDNRNMVCVACIIPKGAKYYKGKQTFGDAGYVSTSIRIEKILRNGEKNVFGNRW